MITSRPRFIAPSTTVQLRKKSNQSMPSHLASQSTNQNLATTHHDFKQSQKDHETWQDSESLIDQTNTLEQTKADSKEGVIEGGRLLEIAKKLKEQPSEKKSDQEGSDGLSHKNTGGGYNAKKTESIYFQTGNHNFSELDTSIHSTSNSHSDHKNIRTYSEGLILQDNLAKNTLGWQSNLNNTSQPTDIKSNNTSVDNSNLQKITQQFQERFSEQASHKKDFHDLMKKSFGDNYNVDKAESIRLQTLNGDFSWIPKVQLVDSSMLQDTSGNQIDGQGLGAYSKDNNTIYLSQDLLQSDPEKAEKILTEEIGHGIDAHINVTDANGDEGDIFSRLSHGESISAVQLAALKSENDSGVIQINGKEVSVEYGFFSGLKKGIKKIGKGIKKVGKAIKKGVKKVGNFVENGVKKVGKFIETGVKKVGKAIKKTFIKVLESKLFNTILTVARFIPIPVVQVAVRAIDVVKGIYTVYQGIKHKSIGAVLGGVASAAGGAAKFAGNIGASAKFVEGAANIAQKAKTASMAYQAIAQKDLTALTGIVSKLAPNSSLAHAMNTASQVQTTHDAIRSKNYVGALQSGIGIVQNIEGGKNALLNKVSTSVDVLSNLQQAARSGDFAKVVDVFAQHNPAWGSIASDAKVVSSIYQAIKSNDYEGAANILSQYNPVWHQVGEGISLVNDVKQAAKSGDYTHVAKLLAEYNPVWNEVAKGTQILAEVQEAANSKDYSKVIDVLSQNNPSWDGVSKGAELLEKIQKVIELGDLKAIEKILLNQYDFNKSA